MMHDIYVQALVQAFHAAMEHWAREEPVPKRYRLVRAWVGCRDSTARPEAARIVAADIRSPR